MKLGVAHQGGPDRTLGQAARLEVPGYRLLERLGGDRQAGIDVWRAAGPGGFEAALRFIRLAPDARPEEVRRADLIRHARHPNLLAAFGSWQVGGSMVLATELPDRTLWDRFLEALAYGEAGVPRDELIDALAEAARGIDYLNGNPPASGTSSRPPGDDRAGPGVPHGEITPRTILFVGGGVKVADIDVARPPDEPARPGLGLSPSADPLAPRWGLDYAAPEWLSGAASRHSDQYSLAVTYFHMRVGRLPFAAGSPQRRADLFGLPALERAAIARALDEDPDARWPSCRDMVDTLRIGAVGGDERAPGLVDEQGPGADSRGRPSVGRSTAISLAAAASAATLAGSLLLNAPAPVERADPDRRADAPPAPPSVALAPARFRLQGPDDPPAPPEAEPGPAVDPVAEPPEVVAGPLVGEATADGPTDPRSAPGPTPAGVINPAEPEALRVIPAEPEAVATTARPSPATIRVEAPAALDVEAGQAVGLPVTVSCEGVDGPVEVRLDGLPRGVSAAPWVGAGVGGDEGAAGRVAAVRPIQVEADAESPEGESLVRLVVTSGSARAETVVWLTVRPSLAEAARCRGDALLGRHEYEQALAAYSEALALHPSDPLALHGRGLAAYGKGDLDQALADIDAALRIKPETPTALNNRGLVRLARGDAIAAIADFDTAAQLAPGFAVVRYNRGRAYDQAGATDQALADYDAAIRSDPGFAKAYKARGDALGRRGDRDGALANYDAAIRIHPDDPTALNNRGLLRFARGDYYRAIADFDAAIRVRPNYAVVRYNRGRVYAFLGDTAEAVASFDHALRLDPTLTRATQARAEVLSRRSEATWTRPSLGVATRRDYRTRPAIP
jgi:tetratricopeptide (TPR) repeat protein